MAAVIAGGGGGGEEGRLVGGNPAARAAAVAAFGIAHRLGDHVIEGTWGTPCGVSFASSIVAAREDMGLTICWKCFLSGFDVVARFVNWSMF